MARARSYFLLGVAAWLAACAETTGPPVPQGPLTRADGQLHHLRWQSPAGRREFVALGNAIALRSSDGAAAPSVLDNYQLGFWAHASKDQQIQINYRAADGSWQPYIWFSVPKEGLLKFPDGRLVAKDDSVLITLAIDTSTLVVHFEPTGLEFSPLAPAQLKVWYTGADPDLDASGAVDTTDSYIEQQLLGVWVQEFAASPWTLVTAVQSVPNKLFSANLSHFSDYAVSW